MRPRSTAMLLVAAVLLGAFIYLYESSLDEVGDADAEPGSLLFSGIAADEIRSIRLRTSDGHLAQIERGDQGWRIVEPLHFEADAVALEAMSSQLEKIEIAGRVEGDAPAADFGLNDDSPWVEFETGRAPLGFRIGDPTPVGSNTYVSRKDSDEVVYVATWRIHGFRKTLTELRNRQVMEFDHASVTGISVSWPGVQVEIVLRDDGWWMTAPVSERADSGTVESLLSDLAFLRADDFIDLASASPAELGLEPSALHIVLHGMSDQGEAWISGLMLGRVQEGRRVARGREGALFTISPERLDDYPRELIAWRWKELSRFVVADARVFELTFHQGGEPTRRVKGVLRAGEWEMTPEPMDPQRARTLVRVLSALEAEEIVAEELGDAEREALGLSPGGLTVRVMGEGDVELAEVAFGVRKVDGGPLAVRSDRTVIYRIASEDGEALPADWSDFMRSFLAGKDTDAEDPLKDSMSDLPDGGSGDRE